MITLALCYMYTSNTHARLSQGSKIFTWFTQAMYYPCTTTSTLALCYMYTSNTHARLPQGSKIFTWFTLYYGLSPTTSPTPCVRSHCLTARLVVWSHWLYFTYVVHLVTLSSRSTCCRVAHTLLRLRGAPRLHHFGRTDSTLTMSCAMATSLFRCTGSTSAILISQQLLWLLISASFD
jgi:hypothetical protein